MKVKQGFVLRKVAAKYVAIPVGELLKEYNGLIQLNETGAFLWRLLERETDEEEAAKELMKEYEGLSRQEAAEDVERFISLIRERGLLEE